MNLVGDPIINNQVQIIVDTTPPDGPGQYPQQVNSYVSSNVAGANYTYQNTVNGIVNYFQTEDAGSYTFRSDIIWANPYRTTSQQLTQEFTTVPVNVLTQTHQLVEATLDPCNNVGILITASREMDQVNGIGIAPSLTHIINKPRGDSLAITIRADDDGATSTKMNSDTVAIMQNVIGADVTYLDVIVEESPDPANPWTYDFGEGYQALNKYHYNTAGTKTIYVKDSYGCVKSVSIEASEIPTVDPTAIESYFFISKANSLRFVDRMADGEVFNDCSNYKTDERTFDCEVPFLDVNMEHTQRVKRCGTLLSQIKSNYLTHTVELWNKTTGVKVTDLTLTKVQANLSVTDTRDCYIVNDAIYSYLYFLDGKVPYFYEIGGQLTIGAETRQIYGFEYLDSEAAYAIKVSLLPGALSSATLQYVFNRQPYDVYEFEIDVPNLPSEAEYYVKIHAERGADIQNWQTVDFYVENSFEQTVDIEYYNDTNTDIYYQSGIKNRLVIGLDTLVPVLDFQTNVINTDSRNFLRSAINRDKRKMLFEPLPLGIMEKLIIALAHEKLVINGTSYACESAELSIPDDYTNMYVITATLYKSSENVKFIAGAGFNFDWSSGQVTFDSSITFDRTSS